MLLGEAAYQTYGGVLGVRLPSRPRRTRDDPAVEIALRDPDRLGGVLDALHTVDPSFATEPQAAGTYRSATGVQVAVTGLDHAADETSDLTGFLIDNPVQSHVLLSPVIPVAVPAPERHAVHALIRAGSNCPQPAPAVRLTEARQLVEALRMANQNDVLIQALAVAPGRDQRWRCGLQIGIATAAVAEIDGNWCPASG